MTESHLSQPWTHSLQEVSKKLNVVIEHGLTAQEAKTRQQKFGPNQLRQAQSRSAWGILVDQFKSLVVLLLVVAAAVSLAFGEWIDSGAIAVVVLINAALGFFTEIRAVRSMEALREMGSVTTAGSDLASVGRCVGLDSGIDRQYYLAIYRLLYS